MHIVIVTEVNPARAGMIRPDSQHFLYLGGKPRASGDDPTVTVASHTITV